MTDQPQFTGPVVSATPVVPVVDLPTEQAAVQSPSLGFTTPPEPVDPATSSVPSTAPAPTATLSIAEALSARSPQSVFVPSSAMVPPSVSPTSELMDKTKMASISRITAPISPTVTRTPPSAQTAISTSPAAYWAPIDTPPSSTPQPPSTVQQPMMDQSPMTLPQPPATLTPVAPVVAQAASTPVDEASSSRDGSSSIMFRYFHFVASFLLVGMGLIGLYATIRYVFVDYPAFEQSFEEDMLGEQVVMNFMVKTGLMLVGTASSFFYVVHTNVFARKQTSLAIVIGSIAAILLAGGMMIAAMMMTL